MNCKNEKLMNYNWNRIYNIFFIIDFSCLMRAFLNLTIVMWYQNGKEVLGLYVQCIRAIKSRKKEKSKNLFQATIMFFNSNYVNWYE